MKRAFLLGLIIFLLAACTPAGSQAEPGLLVQEAWARPGMSGGNAAVYFTIDNASGQADRLLGARCEAAKMVQVHMTVIDVEGNSKMMHQEAVDLPAEDAVIFEPGGLHVMLMDLNEDLQPGQMLPVTLEFEQAGEVQIEAAVREP